MLLVCVNISSGFSMQLTASGHCQPDRWEACGSRELHSTSAGSQPLHGHYAGRPFHPCTDSATTDLFHDHKEESICYDWTNITGTADSIWYFLQVIFNYSFVIELLL